MRLGFEYGRGRVVGHRRAAVGGTDRLIHGDALLRENERLMPQLELHPQASRGQIAVRSFVAALCPSGHHGQ